jgi:hypothetical protein
MPAEFIDYDQILNDFVVVARTVTGKSGEQFKHVDKNLDARDFIISNMPLLDVRWKRVLPEPITNTTYYSEATLEAEICAFDMTSRAECATIRDHLASALQRYLKDHPRFLAASIRRSWGRLTSALEKAKTKGLSWLGLSSSFTSNSIRSDRWHLETAARSPSQKSVRFTAT